MEKCNYCCGSGKIVSWEEAARNEETVTVVSKIKTCPNCRGSGFRKSEAAQPKWISVEDELPKRWRENDKEQILINYQIYSPEYGVDVGNYLKPAGVWTIMGLPVKVTHWMPLPEPPKEDA